MIVLLISLIWCSRLVYSSYVDGFSHFYGLCFSFCFFFVFFLFFLVFLLRAGVLECYFDHAGCLVPLDWPLFVGVLFVCCVRGLLTIVDLFLFDAFYICIFVSSLLELLLCGLRMCDVFSFFYLFCVYSRLIWYCMMCCARPPFPHVFALCLLL